MIEKMNKNKDWFLKAERKIDTPLAKKKKKKTGFK